MKDYIQQRNNEFDEEFLDPADLYTFDSIKHFHTQTIIGLLEKIKEGFEGTRKETGLKMYPDKRTGEMRYLHGNSPSSVCIGCGQKKKAEEQGFNQAIQDQISYLDEQIKELKKEI